VTVADLVRAAAEEESPLHADLLDRARLALAEVARQAEARRAAGRLDPITLEGVLDAAAAVHARAGRREEALALEARGLSLLQAEHAARPSPGHALDNALAWALVTRRDPALNEPARALALVDRALLAIDTGLRLPDPGVRAAYLDTRAAALAAAGRWDEALTEQRAALAAAERSAAPDEVLDHFRGRLAYVEAEVRGSR
jgi:tetratricopeptide (TPR) repeat protein